MGVCPLDPQVRVVKNKNRLLKSILTENTKGLQLYGFYRILVQSIQNIDERYLYNFDLLEDIQRIHNYNKQISQNNQIEYNSEEQLKQSCIILQDEENAFREESKKQPLSSFRNNIQNNQSLIVQINIIYSKQINKEDYSKSLKYFLKWTQMFQKHSFQGLLKPLYKNFILYIQKKQNNQFQQMVDEICVFVQYTVTVVTQIYGLKLLAQKKQGKLYKNENVYNLIMSHIFKRTKIQKYLKEHIRKNEKQKIQKFKQKVQQFKQKNTLFFKIQRNFILQDQNMGQSQVNLSRQSNFYKQPYADSLVLLNQLYKQGSPITKLKHIVAISKQITKDIKQYYRTIQKQVPQLDPDNLTSIVMYLIVKSGNLNLYEDLKIVQYFTTTNCMNCISGYYLNIFMAAIQCILSLKQQIE